MKNINTNSNAEGNNYGKGDKGGGGGGDGADGGDNIMRPNNHQDNHFY